eukprot:2632967-Amphidinium_carterae.1
MSKIVELTRKGQSTGFAYTVFCAFLCMQDASGKKWKMKNNSSMLVQPFRLAHPPSGAAGVGCRPNE